MNVTTHNVKWLDYSKNLLQVQRNIYLSSSMYDVVIASGESRFKAHQLILSASSEFFEQLFKGLPASLTPTVIIPDLNPNLIEQILIFIYGGEVYVQPSILPEFLDCCSFLKIKGFIGCNFLINGVKLEQKNVSVDCSQIIENIETEADNKELNNEATFLEEETVEEVMVCNSNFHEINYSQDQIEVNESEDQIDVNESDYQSDDVFIEESHEFDDEFGTTEVIKSEECGHDEEQCELENIETESYEERIYTAIDQLNQGKTIGQISEEFNIPKLALYSKLRHNTDYRAQYRSLRHEVIDEAVRAVTSGGISLQQASNKFGISKTVLWRNLKKTNLYKPEEKCHAHRNDAIAALERGESLTIISKKFNIPLSTLHRDKVRLFDEGKLPKNCKVRKRESGPDFQNRLKAALISCEKGVSQKAASEMHNIPKTTIWRYMQYNKFNERN